jgi:potassium-dependent mechanosensitive channel
MSYPIRPAPAAPVRDARTLRPRLACLLLVLATLGAAPAHAQLIPGIGLPAPRSETAEPRETAPAAPAAVPIDRIPAQIEASRDLARRAREAARPHANIESVRQQLAGFEQQVAALDNRLALDSLTRADMRSLETELEQVAGLRRMANSLQAPLVRRAAELSDWRDSLRHAIQSWAKTEEAAAQHELPAEVLAGIGSVQAALRDASRVIGERQGEVLAVHSTVGEALAVLEEREAAIEAALALARYELFRPEHPPIWSTEPWSLDLDASRETWRNDRAMLSGYLSTRQGNLWVHLAALVFLLAAVSMLARKVGAWIEAKPDLAGPLAVFRHPLAAALVLAILLYPWLYPDAPAVLRELFGVLLILPLLRVLPLVVPPSLRNPLYLVAGLYLLLRLDGLLASGTALERYSILVLTAATAASVAWIFRPKGPGAKLDAGRGWAAAQLVARLSLVVLAVAILANVGGLVSLASLLTNAVVSSAFSAVVLFAAVVVTRATIVALFQTQFAQRLNLVRWHAAAVDQWLMRILPLVAVLAWLFTTIRLFRIEGVVGGALSSILFTGATIGTVTISLGDILAFALAIWLGLLLSRMLRFILTVDIFPRVTLPRGVAATISMLVNYLVLGIAFVFAVAAAGIQLDRFALIVGALSVGIGFGLQNVVNNFVSGLILAFERPVQSGDTIQFSSMFGKVTRIGVRSSTVRTFDGAEVIVPNANLIANEVTNWTLSDMRRRLEILIGVAYGTKPRKVLEILANVARSDERVLENPAPSVLFLGFGDSSLDFSLRAWTDDFDNYLAIKSDLTLAVHDALYAADIEIPFPQRDLHLRSIDPGAVARIGAIQAPPVGAGGDPADQKA